MAKKASPSLGFRDIANHVKAGKIAPVVLLFGEEQYLVRWAAELIRKKFVMPGMEAMDFVLLEGDTADAGSIVAAAQTYSMLSEKRVVWVRDLGVLSSAGKGDDWESLLRYIEDPGDASILILSCESTDGRNGLVKALKKHAACYEFGKLSPRELRSFAQKRFRGAGLAIKPSVMEQLIRETGYENRESSYRLFSFENDLRKIIAYAEGGEVTPSDVEMMVSGDHDTFIFDLIDGISGNDKRKALEILHNRLSEDAYDGMRILFTIISQMELMYQIREFQDSPEGPQSSAQIAKKMKMNEYRVSRAAGYASRYSRKKLAEMLLAAYECYISSVSGLLPIQTSMELLIARI